MKKIFSLLLCLVLLLPLAACSSSLEAEQTTKELSSDDPKTQESEAEEEESQANVEYPAVCDKLSWEKINAFPLATDSMTVEERRALCVDFFRFCQTFAWTPAQDHDFHYTLSGVTSNKTVKQGTVYGGLPYMRGTGNVYRIMEFYDPETGVVDIKNAAANQRISEISAPSAPPGAGQEWSIPPITNGPRI